MATVVNNTPGETQSSSPYMMVGIFVILAVIAVVVLLNMTSSRPGGIIPNQGSGIPETQQNTNPAQVYPQGGSESSVNIDVPDKVDINIDNPPQQ